MSDSLLRKESQSILKQIHQERNLPLLLCPILKVLEMRHTNLDKIQARIIVKEVLDIK